MTAHRHASPEPNTDEAVEFLEHLHPGGPWHVASMVPDNRLAPSTILNTRFDDLRVWLDEQQGKANVYFHVNRLRPGRQNIKAKKEDIGEIVALHVDIDDPKALDRIKAFEPKPTAIVFSGGGYHAYWLLKSPSTEIERAERCNKALARRLGGDRCHSADHLMRVPGTINIPNAKKRANGRIPALAKVVEVDWLRRHSLDDFAPDDDDPGPAGPKGAVAKTSPSQIVPVHVDQLPSLVSQPTRTLIELGDDPERPLGSETPKYPSRSEVVFRVATDLARAGCGEDVIAGVLVVEPQQVVLGQTESADGRL